MLPVEAIEDAPGEVPPPVPIGDDDDDVVIPLMPPKQKEIRRKVLAPPHGGSAGGGGSGGGDGGGASSSGGGVPVRPPPLPPPESLPVGEPLTPPDCVPVPPVDDDVVIAVEVDPPVPDDDDVVIREPGARKRKREDAPDWVDSLDGCRARFDPAYVVASTGQRSTANWQLMCRLHGPKCIKKKHVSPKDAERFGDVDPLCFLHAWAETPPDPGKTHVQTNPKDDAVVRWGTARQAELPPIVAAAVLARK